MKFLINFILFFCIVTVNVKANQTQINKILFKIGDDAYTTLDLQKRIEYIETINNIKIDKEDIIIKKEILNDYISSLVFNKYNIVNKIKINDIDKQVDQLMNQKINANINDKNKLNIFNNLKMDVIRKNIIENFVNTEKLILNKKNNDLDIIYNYNISYITIENSKINLINFNEIKNREDFKKFKEKLNQNNIPYFYKNNDINDSDKVSKLIKTLINNDTKVYYFNKNNYTTFISLEKNLESYEGIFVKILNFKSDKKLNNNEINCNAINNKDTKYEYKEYEYTKLNNAIKNNLNSINDYIVLKNDSFYNYIILCELRYDSNLLNNINLNKKINILAKEIENNFLKKYKKEFNFEEITK